MKELTTGVYSLGHGKGGHVHAFLLETGSELSLVDTLFENDARLVLDALQRLGRSPTDIKRIAITHGHRSHLGGLAGLKRASGATVYAHRWEADIVAGDRRAQAVSIVPHQSLKLIPFQLGLWLDRPKHTPCPPTSCSTKATRSGRCRSCTRRAIRRATSRSGGRSAGSSSPVMGSRPGPTSARAGRSSISTTRNTRCRSRA
jgi:Metallo-beta-lactamase superfamily